MNPMHIADELIRGNTRALARAITLVENRLPQSYELLKKIFPHSGGAVVVGVTGSPGSGKSTLVDGLIPHIMDAYESLGIIAVDPSSPFSGGAVLGDRIRMMRHSVDPRVFIRSMATRGYLGGLVRPAGDVIALLEAAGKDIVLVETVGVGQDEIEVVRLAEFILVVLTPDTGDDVQLFKAGIMEIADIFVLNKADSPECDVMERRLKALLDMGIRNRPIPPIVKTTASIGEGIDNLWDVIEQYVANLPPRDRDQRQRRRITWMLKTILHDKIAEKLAAALPVSKIEAMVGRVFRHEIDPYTLVERIMQDRGDE